VVTEPHFGIGQRAYLIATPGGNILWDCLSLLDEATAAVIRGTGGLRTIAISHPHYYGAMIEWSRLFDAPVWLHEADREWVVRPDARVRFWSGERQSLFDGLELVRSGGHFEGFQVLHWPAGADGRGVLFAGDQPQVCMDPRWVTFLYSYPNMIPLGPAGVRRVVDSLAPLAFDRIYGAFGRNVLTDAKGVVARSAERYLRFIAT
jgi:glyoxylase-like metal-dependent hydrolase (beta-lactamase superfamily II)